MAGNTGPCDICLDTITEWDAATRDSDRFLSVEPLEDGELEEKVDLNPDELGAATERVARARDAYNSHIKEAHGWT